MSSETDATYYHNKGMSDAHEGDYDPPYSGAKSIGGQSDERMFELNRAYDDGYYYVRGQLDGQKNRYHAPPDSDDQEAYDSGYEHGRNNAPEDDNSDSESDEDSDEDDDD